MIEGDSLLDYLKEIGSKNDQNNDNPSGASNSYKQHSNSYVHLEGKLVYLNFSSDSFNKRWIFAGIINSVKSRYTEIDKLLTTIKTRLETNLQIKLFEKDALEASQNLEHWAEELKYLNENENEDKTAETAESWLHSQIQTANQMQVLVFELLQRGSDLVQHLEKNENSTSLNSLTDILNGSNGNELDKSNDSSAPQTPTSANQHTLNWLKQQNSLNNGSSSSFKNENNLNAKQRIQSLVEYLNEREKELHELAIKQQRKLGQTLQINQLENECSQLLGYTSNIEVTLFSLLKFAHNLDEAEQIKKEHEMFKANLERVSVNVNMLQTKSQRILFDKQQQQQSQQQRPVSKFEQLMNTLNSKWQMLLIYIDNRTRLIMAQINFYKYTDQVRFIIILVWLIKSLVRILILC